MPYSRSETLAADLEAHGHDYVFTDWELGSNGHGWNPELSVAVLGVVPRALTGAPRPGARV